MDRTKQAICEAFSQLLEEKPISKISVREIAAQCGVARNTFYYHFPDIPTLAQEGIPVNMTLCFTVPQAILAARSGARYISPFVGRFDDISEDGIPQLVNVVEAMANYDFGHECEVIAASIRSANHVTQAALMGADIATVPFGVLKKCIEHPLTERGLVSFLNDWEKVANA